MLGVLGLAALLAWFSRRHVDHARLTAENGALQVYITIVAATYGILPTLVFVGQVTNRNDASATVAHESSNILTLFQMTESLPDPRREAAFANPNPRCRPGRCARRMAAGGHPSGA